jgi:multiple sugar transport system ATP-binding protein
MRAEISSLHSRLQATMIYVTHDQVEAMTMGDRIVVMRNGFIQQVGSPMEVYNEPQNQFVAGFIGSPPMNFLEGMLVQDNGAVQVDIKGARLTLPADRARQVEGYVNQPVTFGIRPEDVVPAGSGTGSFSEPLSATVEVLEPLGAEIILEMSCKGENFTARVEPTLRTRMHDEIEVSFNMERAHLFDTKTEQTIL